jgi:hypothetical protein
MKQESTEYFVAFTEAEIRIDRFFLARKRHWLKMQQFVSRDMLEPPPKNWTEIRKQILYRQINGEWEYETQRRERNKRLQKFLEEQRAISEERNRLAQQARSIRQEKQILREARKQPIPQIPRHEIPSGPLYAQTCPCGAMIQGQDCSVVLKTYAHHLLTYHPEFVSELKQLYEKRSEYFPEQNKIPEEKAP